MMKQGKRILAAVLCLTMMAALFCPAAYAVEVGDNLVYNDGTMDGILSDGKEERTLNNDWVVSYPVATFGGDAGDSPAKVRNVDGNNVLVLEYTTGGFASFFADLYEDGTQVPAGEYELSMDLKPVGDGFATDNIGFNLYGQYSDIRIYNEGWQNCTEADDGWLHYSCTFQVEKDSVDSIQMWFNTMGTDPAQCALYIDNLSFTLVTAEPEREELTSEYTVDSGEAITITLPQRAEAVTVAEKAGYTLEEGLDYTYADGVITLDNGYADGLASGETQIIITADDTEYLLLLAIRMPKPALPESKEGYLMQETLVGGDFEMFEEGFAFSLDQVEGWGSNVTYDDPGVIVTKDGSKVLRLQKDAMESYSSAFAFISPTIQTGDVLTLGFDYLLDVADISVYQGADINFCFVSASNMQMCKIPLDNSCPPETSGDGDYQWEVEYTELEDGWKHVEMTFVANTALLSYNSMRFLLPTNNAADGDAMYVDNVSLVLWARSEAPETVSTDVLTFNRETPADVFAMIDLKALDPQKITCGGEAVDAQNWSVNPAKDTITLTKEYLATLENGDYTFTVETAGGSCDFTVHVEGTAESPANSNSAWIWIMTAVAVVVAVMVIVVLQRKKKGGKSE